MLFSSERIFLTLAVRILVSTRFCWRISRLMLRKVFAVDDSANEAQVLWQKLPGIVHDKDAFYVQLYSDLVFSLVQVKRSFRRHVEQRGVVQGSLRLGVKPEQRILRIAGDGFIEFFVILFRELALVTTTKSTGHVDLFGSTDLLRLFLGFIPLALVVSKEDREGDVVGVLLHNLLQAPAVGVLPAFFVEVKKDCGAGDGALCGLNVEARLAVAHPAPGLVFTRLAGDDLDAVGDHEGAVEADPELADEIRIPFCISGKLREEVFRTRAGAGAQVRAQMLLIHADT